MVQITEFMYITNRMVFSGGPQSLLPLYGDAPGGLGLGLGAIFYRKTHILSNSSRIIWIFF